MLYRKIKNSGSGGSTASWVAGDFLKEVPLHDVRLEPDSMHGRAQQTNLEYLLMLDVDSLVWSFRTTAGLEAPGSPYGGWEKPTCELRGHFVGLFLFLYSFPVANWVLELWVMFCIGCWVINLLVSFDYSFFYGDRYELLFCCLGL